MKKIVALVLCLALALSLATVAFGAEVKATYKKDGSENEIKVERNSATPSKLGSSADKDKTGNLAYWKVKDNQTAAGAYLVECDATAATGVLKYNGKTYNVKTVENAPEYRYAAKVDATAGNGKCGSVSEDVVDGLADDQKIVTYKNGDGDEFTWIVSETPNADKMNNLLVDGAVMGCVQDVTDFVEHEFELSKDVDKNETIDAGDQVTCTECKKVATVYTSSTAVPKGYTAVLLDNGLYAAVKDGATAGDDGVTSAETFDAGIAVYAGMALASVAGSAVVIGKKKEF